MRGWMVNARGNRTQKEVSRAAGIRQSYYSMIENGKRRPSVPIAMRLGRVLKTDWKRFFKEDCQGGVD